MDREEWFPCLIRSVDDLIAARVNVMPRRHFDAAFNTRKWIHRTSMEKEESATTLAAALVSMKS